MLVVPLLPVERERVKIEFAKINPKTQNCSVKLLAFITR